MFVEVCVCIVPQQKNKITWINDGLPPINTDQVLANFAGLNI